MEENPQFTEAGAPRHLSPMENVVLTVKILLVAGGIVGFIWMLDRIVNKG